MSSSTNKTYYYEGPVYDGEGNLLCVSWSRYTKADSADRAITNLKYRYREANGLSKTSKLCLRRLCLREGGPAEAKYQTAIEGPLILNKADFTELEWLTICNVFGIVSTDKIALDKYILSFYGIRKENK